MARRLVLRLVVDMGLRALDGGSAPREASSGYRGFGPSLSSAPSRFLGATLLAAGHYGVDSTIGRRERVPLAARGRGCAARFPGSQAPLRSIGGWFSCVVA